MEQEKEDCLHVKVSRVQVSVREECESLVVGYVRPEMRFDGLPALVARIMTDIGLARGALDAEEARGRVDGSLGFQADR